MAEYEVERPLLKVARQSLTTEAEIDAALNASRISASGTITASLQILEAARKKLESQ